MEELPLAQRDGGRIGADRLSVEATDRKSFVMFDGLKKLFAGPKRKEDGQRQRPMIKTCPDCEVPSGQLHDLFCTKERCPFCGGQLISCDCIRKVLRLSEEERLALDVYVDDSVPPLSDVMRRWREALNQKGRVPFEAFPDDPIRAAYRGDVAALSRFLDDGFPINAGNEVGYTALMGASRGESVEMIQMILSRGGQAALADKRGYTALHWAVAQAPVDPARQLQCVRMLIDAGADTNARNEGAITPLMNAAWFGCRDSVTELLKRGADASVRDAKGRTARENASERGHKDIAELLK
jgi:ankyrin repeat protein